MRICTAEVSYMYIFLKWDRFLYLGQKDSWLWLFSEFCKQDWLIYYFSPKIGCWLYLSQFSDFSKIKIILSFSIKQLLCRMIFLLWNIIEKKFRLRIFVQWSLQCNNIFKWDGLMLFVGPKNLLSDVSWKLWNISTCGMISLKCHKYP